MAPRDICDDDLKLTSFLDDLIDSTNEERYETPSATEVILTNIESNFAPSNIAEGILATRVLLRDGGIKVEIPDLEPEKKNERQVIAAILTATVRLARCCKANVNLRCEAEQRVQASNEKYQQVTQTLNATKENLKRREFQVAGLQNTRKDSELKHKKEIRRLNMENADLKTRLTNAGHRENHLALETKRKEREYTQLQQRVHSLMGSVNKVNIVPSVTSGTERNMTTRRPRPLPGMKKNIKKQYKSFTNESISTQVSRLEREIFSYRDLLIAIQGELDDLIQHGVPIRTSVHAQRDDAQREDLNVSNNQTADGVVENAQAMQSSSCSSEDATEDDNDRDDSEHLEDLASGPSLEVSDTHLEETSEEDVQQSNTDSSSVDGDDEGHERLEDEMELTPSVSAEQMSLPFSTFGSDLEASLEQKFMALRAQLTGSR